MARELTRDERKKIRGLVTGMCASYDSETGLCLPLDCPCYMLNKWRTGAYCRYFRRSVLPLNPALETALLEEGPRPRAPALHGLWQALFADGAASLLLRSLQGRGEPQKEPGTYAQNEEENGGLLLRFALWENLILQDF